MKYLEYLKLPICVAVCMVGFTAEVYAVDVRVEAGGGWAIGYVMPKASTPVAVLRRTPEFGSTSS